MKLVNLSLTTKTTIAFMFIMALVTIQFFVSNTSMNNINNNHKEIETKNYQSIIELEEQKIHLVQMRKFESLFILNLDASYIEKHQKESEMFFKNLDKLEQILDSKNLETAKAIGEEVKVYNTKIDDIVGLITKQGNSKSGIRGDLRSIAHDIETFISTSKLSDWYMIQYLNIRRHEKDFLLRLDLKYMDKAKNVSQEIKDRMNKNGLDSVRKEEFTKHLDNYIKTFSTLALNIIEIKKISSAFDEIFSRIEVEIDSLIKNSITTLELRKKEIEEDISQTMIEVLSTSAIIAFIIISINILAFRITKNIVTSVNHIKGLATDFLETSNQINESSSSLSSVSAEQASAIQETASSVNEITAMVSKNSESATNSQAKSEENATAAQQGKETVYNVIKAMNSLSESTKDMSMQFNQTSEELQDVVNIINQIGDKAKVINDIVFQTKLLSFNASVEAARAGEHGKGFAVVAEEVGNLANMSGKSAEEIRLILDESINKVQSLVTNNRREIDSLVTSNTDRVNHGVETAKECEIALNTIISNIDNINASIAEIAHASKEQDSGVREISLAINEFNNNNQRTLELSNVSKNHSDSIKAKAEDVFEMALSLEKTLTGKNTEIVDHSDDDTDQNDQLDIEIDNQAA